MDNHRDSLRMADDLNLGYIGSLAFGDLDNSAADMEILVERLRVIARIYVPPGFPVFIYA
jgi:hypothetical protein